MTKKAFNWKVRRSYLKHTAIGEGQETKAKFKRSSLSIIFSFILGLILLYILGFNGFQVLGHTFKNVLTNKKYFDFAVVRMGALGLSALAAIVAFRSGFINIGISGQMLLGGGSALAISIKLGESVPGGVGQMMTILIACSLGAALAIFSGVLKIFFKINEVVSTIILNWLAFYFIKYVFSARHTSLISSGGYDSKSAPENFAITNSHNVMIVSLVIFVTILLAVWVLMNKTKFGHSSKLVGVNIDAARFAGINTNRVTIISLAISGAIAGMLGVFMYMGPINHSYTLPHSDVVPTDGFDGIALAIIAFYNPIAMMPIAAVFAILKTGILTTATIAPGLTDQYASLLLGIIMYMAAISVLFLQLKPYIWSNMLYFGKRYKSLHAKFLFEKEKLDIEYFDKYAKRDAHKEKIMDEHIVKLKELKAKFKNDKKLLKQKQGGKDD